MLLSSTQRLHRNWSLNWNCMIILRDFAGSYITLDFFDLAESYGVPRVFELPGDSAAPKLINITPLVPSTFSAFTVINVTATPELVFELELFDDYSGIKYIEFLLNDGKGVSSAAAFSLDVVNFPGGGISFKTNATISLNGLPLGNYGFEAFLYDFTDRDTSLTGSQLASRNELPYPIKLVY